MSRRGGWGPKLGLAWLLAVGCGQELVFPEQPSARQGEGGESSGITGAAGAEEAAAAPEKLALPDAPLYSNFGGEGGASPEGGAPPEPNQAQGGREPGGYEPGRAGSGPLPRGGAPGAAEGGASAAEAPGGAGGSGSSDSIPVLYFSEYVEGSSSLKALEIYAPAAASLAGCMLETYFNGKLEPSRLALSGSLPAGGTHVLCSSALAAALPGACDRSTNLSFNGDDALALICQGTTLDVIGQIGVDPGDAWGDGATLDHTLRRSCEVTSGRSDGTRPFSPLDEWLLVDADDFEDLGRRECGSANAEP